jgi:alkylated DNA repair dioxygenase AlkB
MNNPLVSGIYPGENCQLRLIPIDSEAEKKYPWRYYHQFINPELAEAVYNQVESFCVHRQGIWNDKVYQVGRKSCLFSDFDSSNKTRGYGRYSPREFKLSPTLLEIRKKVECFTQLRFPYLLVHIYRTGNDSIPWHRDREAMDPDTSIISISLGAKRKFRFREIGKTSGCLAEYHLNSGDMIWMLPGCQSKVMHTVPVEKSVKEWRINLTFRERIN